MAKNQTDFLTFMKQPEAPRLENAPAPVHGTDAAAKAWHDAISGNGPQVGLADTAKAARTWLDQPFESGKPGNGHMVTG